MANDVFKQERLAAAGLFHHAVGDFTNLEVRADGMSYALQLARFIEGRYEG